MSGGMLVDCARAKSVTAAAIMEIKMIRFMSAPFVECQYSSEWNRYDTLRSAGRDVACYVSTMHLRSATLCQFSSLHRRDAACCSPAKLTVVFLDLNGF